MKKEIEKDFGRVLLPLITVFQKDLSVDYELTRKAARFVVENGLCDAIIVSGTTGEFYTLGLDERRRLFEKIKEELDDEVPLIAGTGAIFTKDAVKLTKTAERLGFNAVMVVTPYYCRPEQEGLYTHFKTIAENTTLPVMIYNIPLFSGVNLLPETLASLAKIENIVAIKDEAGLNPLQTTAYIKAAEGKIAVYSGDDNMVLQVLAQGGIGVVSGGAHVVGDLIKFMINQFIEGNIMSATEIYHSLMDLYIAFHGNGTRVNPTPLVKAAFEMVSGIPCSLPRPPLTSASDEERSRLRRVLKTLGKL
jgi:4-hydroxy-tetrahydrodipicolinate synthase